MVEDYLITIQNKITNRKEKTTASLKKTIVLVGFRL